MMQDDPCIIADKKSAISLVSLFPTKEEQTALRIFSIFIHSDRRDE
jgi:hypothetical protein